MGYVFSFPGGTVDGSESLPPGIVYIYIKPCLTQPMDPQKKGLNFTFPTKYVIPKSLKFSHWPSKL